MTEMDADTKQTSASWPDVTCDKIVFVLETANRLEQELLEDWIKKNKPADSNADVVFVGIPKQGDDESQRQFAALVDVEVETLLAPLRVAWLPSKEQINSGPRLRDLVFGDSRRPKTPRARRILRKYPERVHVVAGAPGLTSSLRERLSQRQHRDTEEIKFVDFVRRQAILTLDIAERRLQGGRYKVPRFVAEHLWASSAYNEAVNQLAESEGRPLPQLREEAGEYMKEMISSPTTFWLDVYAKLNNFMLSLGYEEDLVYDRNDMERMRALVREHPSMLLWTHKTYLDGAVVPKILYDNNFPMPHMFGGANMSFAGLGFLGRRSGAIFIRRSFQDNLLYKVTLRHYIGYLMEKRFPMNWAFEGTRSRLGKLMPPRFGLLKYVLEACHATHAENIHIVPISISFDLIRDVEEYATEQTGRGKGAESLRWFLGYLSSLRKPMGRVYMDLGEPIVLERAPEPDDRLALSRIAFQVAVEANRVTPITLPSMVTMCLLGAAPQALTTGELIRESLALLEWAQARGVRISSDFDPRNADHVRRLLEIMIDERVLTRYDEGPDVVYGIAPEQHPVASYYRNTVIHFFVNKAIIELALLKASEAGGDDPVLAFWTESDNLRDLFKFEFFYSPSDVYREELRQELDRSCPRWAELLPAGEAGYIELSGQLHPLVAHASLLTYIEAYTVVADLLARLEPGQDLDEKTCVATALKYGRQAYLQRRISSEASIGKILFQNAYKAFEHRGLTQAGDSHLVASRKQQAREFHELARRAGRIRAIGEARRVSA